jgi:V8-like Glu-specific endopeptidase
MMTRKRWKEGRKECCTAKNVKKIPVLKGGHKTHEVKVGHGEEVEAAEKNDKKKNVENMKKTRNGNSHLTQKRF